MKRKYDEVDLLNKRIALDPFIDELNFLKSIIDQVEKNSQNTEATIYKLQQIYDIVVYLINTLTKPITNFQSNYVS